MVVTLLRRSLKPRTCTCWRDRAGYILRVIIFFAEQGVRNRFRNLCAFICANFSPDVNTPENCSNVEVLRFSFVSRFDRNSLVWKQILNSEQQRG